MTNIQQPAKGPQKKMRRILLSHLSPVQRKVLMATGIAGGAAMLTYAIQYIMEHHLFSKEALESGAMLPTGADLEAVTAQTLFVEAPENVTNAVSDDMDFVTAFHAARMDCGPGNFFEWRGRSFNTFFKEEFEALTDDQKTQFYAAVRESLPIDQPVLELADHNPVAEEPLPGPETPFPTDFSQIETRGEAIRLDQDGDGKIESVAVDENKDGYIDRIYMDTDHDGDIDRYMRNTDDNIDLDEVLARSDDGKMKLLPDQKAVITLKELQPEVSVAPTPEAPANIPGAALPEYLAEKQGNEPEPMPEPGVIVQDYVAIDPIDLAPGASVEMAETDDLPDEIDGNDPDHGQLPDLENQVDPQL